jgi:hypothetical protein
MSNVLETPVNPITPEEVVRQLRALRDQIPEFELIPRPEKKALIRSASVDPKFVQSSISAVGASEVLRDFVGRSAEELHADIDLTSRWDAVANELRALLTGIDVKITVRRHRIGLTALQTYKAALQLVRRKEHANLLPYVDEMKRRSKFGVRRTREEPPQPQPEPSPGPQPEPLLKSNRQ